MTISLILALIWLIAANVIGMLPFKNNHWPVAYVLIAVGIPLLGYVTYENGPFIGIVALIAGGSVLRWPVLYFGRWIKRQVRRDTD